MALPRRLVKALKAGQYQPTAASKKARDAAANLRQRPQVVAPQRDTFVSTRDRIIRAKHHAFYGDPKYNPRESARVVRVSSELGAMDETIEMSPDEMRDLASLASKAHIRKIKTGSAGSLEVYLQYDFLFYHL